MHEITHCGFVSRVHPEQPSSQHFADNWDIYSLNRSALYRGPDGGISDAHRVQKRSLEEEGSNNNPHGAFEQRQRSSSTGLKLRDSGRTSWVLPTLRAVYRRDSCNRCRAVLPQFRHDKAPNEVQIPGMEFIGLALNDLYLFHDKRFTNGTLVSFRSAN